MPSVLSLSSYHSPAFVPCVCVVVTQVAIIIYIYILRLYFFGFQHKILLVRGTVLFHVTKETVI